MINVHHSLWPRQLERGLVLVSVTNTVAGGQRAWFADPERVCLRRLMTGFCEMEKGHRGRCSTVAFTCDACGHTRRGRPHRSSDEAGVDFCFLCCERDRAPWW